ncbi:MAG TPA: SRPBCC domain-containing protein [Bacilli bacterium]|nr:SRPBCC domain-containing protein [Bacilli bacterium]
MNRDQIEREIFIAAPLQKVWGLVSQPAWWVGEGGPKSVQVKGARVLAETDQHGNFPVIIETSEPPYRLVCRWASTFPDTEPSEGNSTRVEFTLREEDNGTRLRVVESGFSKLDAPDTTRRDAFEGNTQGWIQQLEMLRQWAEEPSV